MSYIKELYHRAHLAGMTSVFAPMSLKAWSTVPITRIPGCSRNVALYSRQSPGSKCTRSSLQRD